MNLKTANEIVATTVLLLPLVHARDHAYSHRNLAGATAAIQQLKKLTHPTSDPAHPGPFRLSSRRLRRQATRIVAKEKRRLERECAQHGVPSREPTSWAARMSSAHPHHH